MNKTELVAKIAEKAEIKKVDAEKALKAFEEARLVGFGTFDVKERAAHEGVNPQSGEKIQIAASKAPRFKAGKALKDAVNK